MLTRKSQSFDLSFVRSFLFAALITLVSAPAFARDNVYDFGTEEISLEAVKLEFPFVPEASMTSGSLCAPTDPDFGYLRYSEKIPYCNRNVEYGTKTAIYKAYGISQNCRGEYTIDHFIPLSLGGSNHVDNLWPEHKSIKHLRQNLEIDLYKKLDQGKITQAAAIKIIRQQKLNPPVENPGDFEFCR